MRPARLPLAAGNRGDGGNRVDESVHIDADKAWFSSLSPRAALSLRSTAGSSATDSDETLLSAAGCPDVKRLQGHLPASGSCAMSPRESPQSTPSRTLTSSLRMASPPTTSPVVARQLGFTGSASRPSGPPQARCSSAPKGQRSPSPCKTQRSELFRSATDTGKGDVSVCVRVRPNPPEHESCVAVDGQFPGGVRLLGGTRLDPTVEVTYQYDTVFDQSSSQEQVYSTAVEPICDAVLRGYNGAVIAYGQTGSGKTHTVLGNHHNKGVAAHAVNAIFIALAKRPCWGVEVSVLEIYNERVRDLLAAGSAPVHVDIHEVPSDHEGHLSFRCPEASRRRVQTPEEALAALSEGMRRRETARTDQNHSSSRSHLIFTLSTSQRDERLGATLHGRLHLVDLAGSERLKRSMSSSGAGDLLQQRSKPGPSRSPQDQRREAGEINKSLSQLALVIARLTCPSGTSQMVPYRDSCLTRLLAESFGGSSKTCLIITCSADVSDLQETRSSLEFGKRAKLVKNRAEINVEVAHAPTPVMQALVAKQLIQMKRGCEELLRERSGLQQDTATASKRAEEADTLLREAVADALRQQEKRATDVQQLQEAMRLLQQRFDEEVASAARAQESSDAEVARLQAESQMLHRQLLEATTQLSRMEREQRSRDSELRGQLAERRRQLEEEGSHAEELRRQVQYLGVERASLQARLDVQQAKIRAEWDEEVSHLRHENAVIMAAAREERSLLRLELREAREAAARGSARSPGAAGRPWSPLFERRSTPEPALPSEESDEGLLLPAPLTKPKADTSDFLEVASPSAADRMAGQTDDRLAAVQVEGASLRNKWRDRLGEASGSPTSQGSRGSGAHATPRSHAGSPPADGLAAARGLAATAVSSAAAASPASSSPGRASTCSSNHAAVMAFVERGSRIASAASPINFPGSPCSPGSEASQSLAAAAAAATAVSKGSPSAMAADRKGSKAVSEADTAGGGSS